MKWLVVLLLLANVAYFGWQFESRRAAPVQTPIAEVAQPPGKRLVLLSEAPGPETPTTASSAAREDTPASQTEPVGGVDGGGAPEPGTTTAKPEQKMPDLPAETTMTAEQPAQEEPESPAETTMTAKQPAQKAPEPVRPAQCFRVDGIARAAETAAVAVRVRKAGATVVGRGEGRQTVTTYRALLPPASAAALKRAVERLERARIKDFYVIRSGEDANAISLGVFSTRNAAKRRAAEIAALRPSPGRPRVEATELEMARLWLVVRWAASPPRGWRDLLPNGVTVTTTACP